MNRVNLLLFLSLLISLVLFSCTHTSSDNSEPKIDLTAFPPTTKIVLEWPGGTFNVKVIDPEGNVIRETESSEPPIIVDLQTHQKGDWQIKVIAIPVDPPEAASVGAFEPEDLQYKQALELCRKVIKIESALKVPERLSSIDAVRELGSETRYYPMVIGWIMEHFKIAYSYRDTAEYKKSKQRRNEIENRIAALQRMVRAIDRD